MVINASNRGMECAASQLRAQPVIRDPWDFCAELSDTTPTAAPDGFYSATEHKPILEYARLKDQKA